MSIVYARIQETGKPVIEVVRGVNIADLETVIDAVIARSKDKYVMVYQHDAYTYHYIRRSQTIFLCVTDLQFPTRIGHGFLQCLLNEYSGTPDFETTLRARMEWYSKEKLDIIHRMSADIDEPPHALNMEMLLEPYCDETGLAQQNNTPLMLCIGVVLFFYAIICLFLLIILIYYLIQTLLY